LSKRILVVRTDRVGDVVMITPMIRELRKAFPEAFIATLTQQNTSEILLNNPYLDKILIDDLKKENFWEVVKELKKYKFTDGLLVLPTERAAYQLFRAGIRKRIGVGHKLYEVITFMKSVSRNNYVPLRHEADYCMDLVRKLGVVTDNIQPEIFISEKEKIWIDSFYKTNNINRKKYKIIIHTGSKNSAPNWSEDKYFELIETMHNKFKNDDFVLLLTAYEMTDMLKNKIASLDDKRIINISDKLKNLRELIKIISSIDLMICSSTGPIHLADALNIKCIGIHCNRPMNCSRYWGVLNKKSVNLEVPKEYCDSHCSSDKNVCNFENGISVEEVMKHIFIKQNVL
jgi:heptosyltransferase-2